MATILRTHGGLGNQIFQIFYARLYCQKNSQDLFEIHDRNYQHAFQRCSALKVYPEPNSILIKTISSMRIPKILTRFFRYQERPISILGNSYIDGYFQDYKTLSIFKPNSIRSNLDKIKDELKVENIKTRNHLVHIRLGDFFSSKEEAKSHLLSRLSNIPSSSHVISNEDFFFNEDDTKKLLDDRRCKYISTSGYSPEELIRFMSKYETVDANDSTLVFWSSVLANTKIDFNNINLKHYYKFLFNLSR